MNKIVNHSLLGVTFCLGGGLAYKYLKDWYDNKSIKLEKFDYKELANPGLLVGLSIGITKCCLKNYLLSFFVSNKQILDKTD